MSPRLRRVLKLVEDLELDPRELRVLRDALSAREEATPERKAPPISQAIFNELLWRFENDTGRGMAHDRAIDKAVQSVRAARKKASA